MDVTLETHLARALDRDGPIVFLTGAGVSAESGIPTFRGPEGYWTVGSRVYQPQELATRQAFGTMPDEVWRWYLYRRGVCKAAEPNAAHRAIAALAHALGERLLLVTQNVDGLHLRAGSPAAGTLQVHGNIHHMRCSGEHDDVVVPIPDGVPLVERDSPFPEEARALLRCVTCGRATRPHVLWFDEYYDEQLYRFHTALDAAQRAAVLVTAGTAGATNLPNQMVMAARRGGALLIDVNPDANAFSRAAEAAGGLWLRGPATRELPRIETAIVNAPR